MGTFLAVDGSAMTLVHSSTGYVMYLPNGDRYEFPPDEQNAGSIYATSFVDVNGNTMDYYDIIESFGRHQVWEDTIGRAIDDPIPHNWSMQTQVPGTQPVNMPGLGGGVQQYQITWSHLKPPGCEADTSLSCVGYDGETGGALVDQRDKLFFSALFSCNGNQRRNLWQTENQEVLFQIGWDGLRPCNPMGILRDNKGIELLDGNGEPVIGPVRFNPVVLSQLTLSNGQSYSFAYNRYGEISKITYPTGSYEEFDYAAVPIFGSASSDAYDQMNRGVTARRVYNANNSLEQTWTYAGTY
jgi:hypothetical protein